MKRTILGWALALASAGTVLSGCELLRHQQRSEPADEPAGESDEPKSTQLKSESPRTFFKGTRLPGALSSEAADIERNLGVK